jgi:hypothetical protein
MYNWANGRISLRDGYLKSGWAKIVDKFSDALDMASGVPLRSTSHTISCVEEMAQRQSASV